MFELRVLVLEVSNQVLHLRIALFKSDFHNMNDLIRTKSCTILAFQHLLGTELALVDAVDFFNGHHNDGSLGKALEGLLIFVHEKAEFVEH